MVKSFLNIVGPIFLIIAVILTLLELRISPILDVISRGKSADESDGYLLILVLLAPFILSTLAILQNIILSIDKSEKLLSSSIDKNSELLKRVFGMPSSDSPALIKKFYSNLYDCNRESLEKSKIEPEEIYESVSVFKKLLCNVSEEYISINSFFGKSSATDLNYLVKQDIYESSKNFASERHDVKVKRYFLLYSPDTYKEYKKKNRENDEDSRYESPEEILEAMSDQYEHKIEVFYGDIRDVKKATGLPEKKLYKNRALMDKEISLCGVIDGSKSKLERITFSWNKRDIKYCNDILESLKSEENNTLKRFDPEDNDEIHVWISDCNPKG